MLPTLQRQYHRTAPPRNHLPLTPDPDILRRFLAARDITATIPPRRFSWRDLRISYDKASYRTRHLVENLFADLKQFRGLATRYRKLTSRFASFVALAGWFIATRHL